MPVFITRTQGVCRGRTCGGYGGSVVFLHLPCPLHIHPHESNHVIIVRFSISFCQTSLGHHGLLDTVPSGNTQDAVLHTIKLTSLGHQRRKHVQQQPVDLWSGLSSVWQYCGEFDQQQQGGAGNWFKLIRSIETLPSLHIFSYKTDWKASAGMICEIKITKPFSLPLLRLSLNVIAMMPNLYTLRSKYLWCHFF